ncbi:putative DNA-directed primase/polymerase protein [Chloropicon primus]|uniref:DNA-directed primase/polymerase protein n=1 Tax=Chloropicon primus TaxID=1764295 RepID=A0A5B8N105_9CHLO|nr:putative DNA-directed primase/polymerase protein [Chloropicon primus]UPR04660.1 putative DNA-directed primase/polymerase protein [Chloropicon primus]|eukprot:QDZ25464.1 putative DNA-directed primase/polymerase protein [Chloropicon primus]
MAGGGRISFARRECQATCLPSFDPVGSFRGRNLASDPFKTFSRQKQMFQWVDGLGATEKRSVKYFTFETSVVRSASSSFSSSQEHRRTKRVFLATTLRRFWRHYSIMPALSRHHYELIREGEPCSMYFDLEFAVKHNAGLTAQGDHLVDVVLELTARELLERFGLGIDLGKDVVELDSSTETKWSRHLIIHCGGNSLLASNAHAGAIALSVVNRLFSKLEEDGGDRYRSLLVRNGEGAETPLIDLSVYSRNRTFRIFKSSKFGKHAELRSTSRFVGGDYLKEEAGQVNADQKDKTFFLSSLVCGQCPKEKKLLHCEEVLRVASESKPFNPTSRSNARAGCASAPARIEEGDGHLAKFPLLASFIARTMSPDGQPLGRIRSHVHFVESGTIILNLATNRYCSRIKRQHKSNGVFLVVDCSLGYWWQKCYDPDCRSYRGDPQALPLDVLVEVSEEIQQVAEDEDFLRAIDEIEERHLHCQNKHVVSKY